MAGKCTTRKQISVLSPGDIVSAGCELLNGTSLLDGHEGSIIINNGAIFPPYIVGYSQNAVVGPNGAVVMCPTDNAFSFNPGESIPDGTVIVSGCVIIDKGEGPEEVCVDNDPNPDSDTLGLIDECMKENPTFTFEQCWEEIELDKYISENNVDETDTDAVNAARDAVKDAIARKVAGVVKPITVGPPPETVVASKPVPIGNVTDVAESDLMAGGGFCAGWGSPIPTEEEADWLSSLSDITIPDFKGLSLSGFTAFIMKLMGKLSAILGQFQAEVDKLLNAVSIDPEKACTPPMKERIRQMQEILKRLMKMIPIMQKIIRVIKIVQRVMKAVKMAMRFVGLPYIPGGLIVEAMMKAMNLMGLVDTMVGLLVQTAGRFVAVIPLLFAQLYGILAACGAQAGGAPTTKEECDDLLGDKAVAGDPDGVTAICDGEEVNIPAGEEIPIGCKITGGDYTLDGEDKTAPPEYEVQGGPWLDSSDLKNLNDSLNALNATAGNMYGDDSDKICYCTKPEFETQAECEAVGEEWICIDTSDIDNIDSIDLSALQKELGTQLGELDECMRSDELGNL
tara:strand:+ start:1222 stop:2922 length:1701 start_codon:yes stop_codon:yes gene_type:complete